MFASVFIFCKKKMKNGIELFIFVLYDTIACPDISLTCNIITSLGTLLMIDT